MSGIEELLREIRGERDLQREVAHHALVPARAAELADSPSPAWERVRRSPALRGTRLFAHQARALDLLAEGRDVVLATGTASGKTLVYQVPALAQALAEPGSHSLFLFPLRALEQDQQQRLRAAAEALGIGEDGAPVVAVYDGDTPSAERRRLRERPPAVLITTPDMLHAGILPSHGTWQALFRALRLVVVDELHTYRGIFGSHVAQVLRRLERIAAHHGSRPQLVAASATVANPGELGRAPHRARDRRRRPRRRAPPRAPRAPAASPRLGLHQRRPPVPPRGAQRPAHHRLHQGAGHRRAHVHLGGASPIPGSASASRPTARATSRASAARSSARSSRDGCWA